MTKTYRANVELKTSVQETLDATSAPAADSPQITHAGWDFSHSLQASSTPPLSAHAAFQQALTAGAATVDLTALDGLGGSTVNATGLKLQTLKLRNPSTNSGAITISPGASNGYDYLGAGMSLTLQPGDEIIAYTPETAPDVGATDKTLDLAGTGTEALDMELLFG